MFLLQLMLQIMAGSNGILLDIVDVGGRVKMRYEWKSNL